MDMRVGDLHYGRGAAVVVHEDVATLPTISFDLPPQMTRRYIEEEYAVRSSYWLVTPLPTLSTGLRSGPPGSGAGLHHFLRNI